MRLLIAICLLTSLSVGAQTANVIELTPVDAARAQKAWTTLLNAQVEWKAVRSEIEANYVKRPCAVKGCTLALPVEGFDGDFEFSKDFKMIVPKPQTWTTSGTIVGSTYPVYPCWNSPPCTGTNCAIHYN